MTTKSERGPIDWPLVVLIGLVLAAALAALRVLGVTKADLAAISAEQWITIAAIVGGAVGTVVAAFRQHVLGRAPATTAPAPRRREEGSIDARLLVYVLAWGLGAMLSLAHLTGCATARDTARTVVYASAEALDTVDQIEARRYVEAHERALAASETLAEYVEAMRAENEIEAALVDARAAILAGRALVAAWDAGAEERWLGVAGCIASAIAHLVALLEAHDVDIPPEVGSALALVSSAGAAACPGGVS